jgi:GntR family negative regulator for fad regulon and positive regulator of fabA
MTADQQSLRKQEMSPAWTPPPRPAELTEARLVQAFLEHEFPEGSTLPAERELAALLGITRPTVREALQRLSRDGWITIQQGKPTRVNDFWWEGNLNVLDAIVRHARELPPDFVPNLLSVRLELAPAYTRAAIDKSPNDVAGFLESLLKLPDVATEYATADWRLHLHLIRLSGNPVYMLIFNGFSGFYVAMAQIYFAQSESRAASRGFYQALHAAACHNDPEAAARAAQKGMEQSITLWLEATT